MPAVLVAIDCRACAVPPAGVNDIHVVEAWSMVEARMLAIDYECRW